ncbi:hypothetical protein [Streptomyces sp. NPDC094468]|uniref:hypothetical protein n=1 Tax=Streptomyces sp. NPDC094468 TaxID=3366066 RepID=UPI00382B1F8D
MAKQLDQMPSDPGTLARKVAALERQMKELRAARRMGSASVGRLRLYSADGATLLAELGPTDGGGGGLWTRGTQDDGTPVKASLANGEVRFEPLDKNGAEVPGTITYQAIPGLATDLILTPGGIEESDWQPIVDIGGVTNGEIPNVLVSSFRTVNGSGDFGPCNMDVSGVLTFANIAYGSVSITPSAPNTPTSAVISGLGLQGSAFYAQVSANTSVPGTSVTGVSFNNLSASGLTVWLTRANTTTTGVNWMVIGV